MPVFLQQLAQIVIQESSPQLHTALVVLPTRRAGLFFKRALANELQQTVLLPKVITPEELVQELCGATPSSGREVLFEFYNVYRALEKDKADEFEKFLKWAPQLLTDFNDIDRYLLSPQAVFTDLRNIKELDMSFATENLSQMQERFLQFWNKLGIWYEALHSHLAAKGILSIGMAYRKAAESSPQNIQNLPFSRVYLAGFNALSKSENIIFKAFSDTGKGSIIWDYDNYYTTDNEIHEAGYFYRQNRERIPNSRFIKEDNFNRIEKIVHLPCPGPTAQTLQTANLLDKQEPLNEKTAIVLADERLLPALLNALPKKIDKLNITMGYKLKQTAAFSLIKLLLEVQKKNERQGTTSILTYHKDLISLLQHPFVAPALSLLDANYDVRYILRRLAEKNRLFIGEGFLKGQFDGKSLELLTTLLSPFQDAKSYINQLRKSLYSLLEISRITETGFLSVLEKAAIGKLISVFNTLESQVNTLGFDIQARAFWRLLLSDIAKESIDLYGEPFGGLQVMGLLETRGLDFETVYLLSANEDVLPGQNREVSFLPFEVKKFHELPTYKERDSVYAYHFYRLLQRSHKAHILHARNENGEEKEVSRFVTQLEYEFPRIEKVNPPRFFETETPRPVMLEGKDLIEKFNALVTNGISPSAVNKWLNCPLDFMFQYVLGLRESEDEVEESMEYSTFGSLIHNALEIFYKEFEGKKLVVEKIQEKKKKIKECVRQAMLEVFEQEDIDKGLNYLNRQVIEKMCLRYIDFDCEELKKNGATTLLKLEERLKASLPFSMGNSTTITFKGFADRIEESQGIIKILDYKTGKAESKELSINSKDFEDKDALAKKGKALQLLFYAALYNRCHPENSLPVQPAIIPLKKLGSGMMPLEFNGKTSLNSGDIAEAEGLLLGLVAKVFDPGQVFTHKKNAPYCQYCR